MFIRIKDTIINADVIKTVSTGLFERIFIEFTNGNYMEFKFDSKRECADMLDRIELAICTPMNRRYYNPED